MRRPYNDLDLPPNCIISGIIRHGEIVIPRGVTALEAEDEILALVNDVARLQLEKSWDARKIFQLPDSYELASNVAPALGTIEDS